MRSRVLATFALALVIGGCAVRLGGPRPEEYRTLAYVATPGESVEATAARIASVSADIVLLAADQDSAWFAAVAERTQLALSGPGQTGTRRMAFLTRRLELLGDTTISLNVTSGGRLHMHDALYQIGQGRHVDLMLIEMEEAAELRDAIRTLLSYFATDVGANAAVIFALDTPTPQLADSAAVLLRAAYADAWECADASRADDASPPMEARLFYGPAVRMRCQSARVLPEPGSPISAQLVVGR